MLDKEGCGCKQERKKQKLKHSEIMCTLQAHFCQEFVFHIEPPALTHFASPKCHIAVTISMHRPAKLLMCGQILETCKCGAIHLHSV